MSTTKQRPTYNLARVNNLKKRVWIIALIMLTGCNFSPFNISSQRQINDGGLLYSTPCAPPCFFGITPGSTTDYEAVKTISINEDIFSNCKQYDNRSVGGLRGLICGDYIGVLFSENIVGAVSFLPSSKITLEQVIQRYGQPDLIDAYISSLPDKPFTSKVFIFFDNLHAVLELIEQPGTKMQIKPDEIISTVTYWSEEEYNSKISSSENRGVSWRGYGDYEAKLP
jgi:hypothetical protein